MSKRMLRRLASRPFPASPPPDRLPVEQVARALEQSGQDGRRLRPGERIVDGQVHYSAAWLDETYEPEPGPAEETVDVPAQLMLAWASERGAGCSARMELLLEKWAAEGPECEVDADIPVRLRAVGGEWTLELPLSLKRLGELTEVIDP